MISSQKKGLNRQKGHSKTSSTDTLYSQKRTKFLSVVSAGNHATGGSGTTATD